MEKEFEMSNDELEELKAIAREPSIPVMRFGDHWSGNEKQESANEFWKRLGKKYGFIWYSCSPSPDKGHRFFRAQPKKNLTD